MTPISTDEIEEDDDDVHAFEIKDDKIDVRVYSHVHRTESQIMLCIRMSKSGAMNLNIRCSRNTISEMIP